MVAVTDHGFALGVQGGGVPQGATFGGGGPGGANWGGGGYMPPMPCVGYSRAPIRPLLLPKNYSGSIQEMLSHHTFATGPRPLEGV